MLDVLPYYHCAYWHVRLSRTVINKLLTYLLTYLFSTAIIRCAMFNRCYEKLTLDLTSGVQSRK